jgi:hypothetical protein
MSLPRASQKERAASWEAARSQSRNFFELASYFVFPSGFVASSFFAFFKLFFAIFFSLSIAPLGRMPLMYASVAPFCVDWRSAS